MKILGTEKAQTMIEKSNLSEREKNFIVQHLNALEFSVNSLNNDLNLLLSKNEGLELINSKNYSYESEKEYLKLKFIKLSNIIEEVEKLISENICPECGHIFLTNIRKLLKYTEEITKDDNEDDLFKIIMNTFQ